MKYNSLTNFISNRRHRTKRLEKMEKNLESGYCMTTVSSYYCNIWLQYSLTGLGTLHPHPFIWVKFVRRNLGLSPERNSSLGMCLIKILTEFLWIEILENTSDCSSVSRICTIHSEISIVLLRKWRRKDDRKESKRATNPTDSSKGRHNVHFARESIEMSTDSSPYFFHKI